MDSLGLADSQALRQILETCEDPVQAINQFQANNGIEVVSLQPALKLLDLHSIGRHEFHSQLLTDLVAIMIKQINKIAENNTKKDNKTIEKLLDETFALRNVAQIKPIVLQALDSLNQIPKSYFKKIADDSVLYKSVSVQVKQQLWLMDLDLFVKEIQPHVQNFVLDRKAQFIDIEFKNVNCVFGSNTKVRRGCAQVQELLQMIGEKDVLYDKLIQTIRQEYGETKSSELCSLRYELLMGVHDLERRSLTELDPCHSFAWCIDPQIRERHLDNKHINELKTFVDGLKKKDSVVWADICMLCADSHIIHFMGLLLSKIVSNHCAQEGLLPRDSHSLPMLLRILALGTTPNEKAHKEPKVGSWITTDFMCELVILAMEDLTRMEIQNAQGNHNNSCIVDELMPKSQNDSQFKQLIEESYSQPLSHVTESLARDSLCAWIFSYYIFHLMGTKTRNTDALIRYIPLLCLCPSVSYSDHFLFIFICKLISLYTNDVIKIATKTTNLGVTSTGLGISGDDVTSLSAPQKSQHNQKLESAIFEQFLLKENKNTMMKWHLLRFLNHCGEKIDKIRCEIVIKYLNPGINQQTDDNFTNSFNKIQQRLAVIHANIM